jgi:hypothetical protein
VKAATGSGTRPQVELRPGLAGGVQIGPERLDGRGDGRALTGSAAGREYRDSATLAAHCVQEEVREGSEGSELWGANRRVWADNETEIDLLGFDFLVDGLVIALSEPRLLPLTVGVLGDWGSGKSSLMGLACAELVAEGASPDGDRYVCVRFSPWQYEDYEDVKVALMAVVLTRLADEAADDADQQEEVGRLDAFVRGFRRRSRRVVRGGVELLPTAVPAVAAVVDPSLDPTLIAVAQQGVQSATAGVAERLTEPTSAQDEEPITDVAEFRTRFAALVKSLDHVAAVVVFIDDLDRCLPETVVDTFEAIRLLLGAPQTAFVVAANQKIVESAVDARYPELRDDNRARGIGAQYLEKMLQLKIAVPALAVPEAVTYINLLLAELHLREDDFAWVREHVAGQRATHSLEVAFTLGTLGDLDVAVPAELVADLEWAAAIAPVLAAGSRGNPRQIKLFLNTLQLRRRSAKRRGVTLDPAVLAKLMLLEDQLIDDFQQVFDWQVESGGPSCPPSRRRRRRRPMAVGRRRAERRPAGPRRHRSTTRYGSGPPGRRSGRGCGCRPGWPRWTCGRTSPTPGTGSASLRCPQPDCPVRSSSCSAGCWARPTGCAARVSTAWPPRSPPTGMWWSTRSRGRC